MLPSASKLTKHHERVAVRHGIGLLMVSLARVRACPVRSDVQSPEKGEDKPRVGPGERVVGRELGRDGEEQALRARES